MTVPDATRYLDHAVYCDEIVCQTEELRSHLSGADLNSKVPTCPDWSLRDLAVHVSGAHRWVAEIVRTKATSQLPREQVPGADGPASDEPAALDAWLAEGAELCAGALRDAGPDAPTWTWVGESTTAFWARRMAHETVVHRADAAGATGAEYRLAPEVAADAIDEWLGIIAFIQAARGGKAADALRGGGRTIHLHATDAPGAEWLIELADEGVTWRRAHEKATVALRGPLTDVMRVFYRRLPVDTPAVEVLGDADVLDQWLAATAF
ncbi:MULTISPECIES: maleylpyruvate isomerase family mycothiol-dependent enzyme [unclassified Streptomyces]|uniref:maleylpyruvate isomerase family mycothiol-dependent enzyme n=1 Tax=unclassified Streptomyces TaxID=2593676 RepID=UPI0037FECF68